MQIEFTEQMRKEVVQQVSAQLPKEVRQLINTNKLAETIKAELKGQLTSQIAGDFHKKLNTSDLVNSAMASAEQRINARIQKVIERGVSLKISLTEKEQQ